MHYQPFENIAAQEQKFDFPSFSGQLKNGHISTIFNFQTLIFLKTNCLPECNHITKTKESTFLKLSPSTQSAPFLQTLAFKTILGNQQK